MNMSKTVLMTTEEDVKTSLKGKNRFIYSRQPKIANMLINALLVNVIEGDKLKTLGLFLLLEGNQLFLFSISSALSWITISALLLVFYQLTSFKQAAKAVYPYRCN